MGKCCVAAGCFNTNANYISHFHFLRDPSLHAQWNKQVQRTRTDWKDATKYPVLRSNHFTSDCFKEDSYIATQFGITQKKRLKPDAVLTIFDRPGYRGDLQESSSMGHKKELWWQEMNQSSRKEKNSI